LRAIFDELAAAPGVESAHLLPALRRFKIHVAFDPGDNQS
jgi:hypothetical protein